MCREGWGRMAILMIAVRICVRYSSQSDIYVGPLAQEQRGKQSVFSHSLFFLVAQPDSDPGCLPRSLFPLCNIMVTEMSPQAMRMRISDPLEVPVEMQNWSDPELRHEVRTLKAMVRSLLGQEAETRVKHNMLLEKTYKEFKSVHERKVVADNQFLQVGEHFTGVSQKMADMQGGLNTLFEQMGLAKCPATLHKS